MASPQIAIPGIERKKKTSRPLSIVDFIDSLRAEVLDFITASQARLESSGGRLSAEDMQVWQQGEALRRRLNGEG